MEDQFSEQDRREILEGIRRKYAKVGKSSRGMFKYPTGRDGLEKLGYDANLLKKLPEEVLASFCGVGNPFSLGAIPPDAAVLDLGCGGGVDTLLAGIMAGPEGRAVGVELVPEMLARAQANLRLSGLSNTVFMAGSAEDLPFPDDSFDVVLSNGAFNLVPDKGKALSEAFRVLKPGGGLMMADQVLSEPMARAPKERIANWFR